MKRLAVSGWLGVATISSLALFYACEDGDRIQMNEQSALTEDLGGGGDDSDLPYLNPIPMEPIPEEIRGADEATALGWAMNLSRDDLQRYGIVGVRGADPRRDVPEEYENRDGVIEMLFKIGLYAGGVESIENPSRWIREHSNHEQGGISFPMLDADGPDWGWTGEISSLDYPCESPNFTVYYYLWRSQGGSGNSIFPWKGAPESADSNRRITTDSSIHTTLPPSGSTICSIQMIYKSETSQDGRFMQGTTNTSTQHGYLRGLGSTTGQNIRPSGLPNWQRTVAGNCIHSGTCGCGGASIIQPTNINPPARYLTDAYSGTSRYHDFITTTCTGFTCDSCWYLGYEFGECEDLSDCCSRDPSLDSCFYTTGTHQAIVWSYGGNYYNATDDPRPGEGSRRVVEYNDTAFVTSSAGTHSRGGWMNQVVFSSTSSNGTFSYLDDDGVMTPTGSYNQNGNSQSINVIISDSAAWLNNKYLRIGARPFWKWTAYKGGNYVPYYLQLGIGTTGAVGCSGSYTVYNDWDIDSLSNPFYCTTGDNLYAGCVTWDHCQDCTNHDPWDSGGGQTRNGWLYPSVCLQRELPDSACPSPVTASTHYPMKSKLANGTTLGGGEIYSGSYLFVKYHLPTW